MSIGGGRLAYYVSIMESQPLQRQVALVTGGGRGLGRAFAAGLAKAGARVAVVSRTVDELAETVRMIEITGGEARAFPADVSDPAAVAAMVQSVERSLGPVELLVNGAGAGGPFGPTWETDAGQWWRCLEVNLRGCFLCCHALLPGMIARRRGRIINVASGAGTVAVPYMSAYVTSKTAVIRFTETLAAELRTSGVSVFSIQPGTVRTRMAEHLLESDAGRKWLPWFGEIFEQGKDDTVEPGTRLVLFLALGAGDALSGRFLAVPDNPAEVARRATEVERDELYVLRMRRLE